MKIKFFGQYLVDENFITSSDLLNALELQESNNRRFGDIVLDLGFMDAKQVKTVHESQRTNDLMFGEMAIELGYINSEQVERVIKKQNETYLYIGEALVELGLLSSHQLSLHLENFKQKYSSKSPEELIMPIELPHREAIVTIVDMMQKMLIRVANLKCRFGEARWANQVPENNIFMGVRFLGDLKLRLIISFDENCQEYVVGALMKEIVPRTNSKQAQEAALLSFLDLVCENSAKKHAQLNHDITVEKAHIDTIQNCARGENEAGLTLQVGLPDNNKFDITMFVEI